MKKWRRLLSGGLAVVMAASLAACSSTSGQTESVAKTEGGGYRF